MHATAFVDFDICYLMVALRKLHSMTYGPTFIRYNKKFETLKSLKQR